MLGIWEKSPHEIQKQHFAFEVDIDDMQPAIAALHEKGILGPDEHDYLAGGFKHISRLLLRQQIADFQAGKPVSNYVDPDGLSQREKDILTDSFKAIRNLRDRMKSELTGEIF